MAYAESDRSNGPLIQSLKNGRFRALKAIDTANQRISELMIDIQNAEMEPNNGPLIETLKKIIDQQLEAIDAATKEIFDLEVQLFDLGVEFPIEG